MTVDGRAYLPLIFPEFAGQVSVGLVLPTLPGIEDPLISLRVSISRAAALCLFLLSSFISRARPRGVRFGLRLPLRAWRNALRSAAPAHCPGEKVLDFPDELQDTMTGLPVRGCPDKEAFHLGG